ncbi:hypothetical protein NCCP28_20210 [Niallia sp. NCCP-28]|nr:hypothetical protein NCCP28_20210 [Niallia sp. NCCP-28]
MVRMITIKLGQKVIYKQKIHFMFYDYENGLLEIQNALTKAIILVKIKELIYRLK